MTTSHEGRHGVLRPRVFTARDVAGDPSVQQDSYLAKVVKYIPGEIVAAFVATEGILSSADVPKEAVMWIVVGLLVVLTPVWTLVATNAPGKPKPIFQAVAATFAFVVWVFALGGPFVFQPWYNPAYGSLALIFATLIIPLAENIFVRPSG